MRFDLVTFRSTVKCHSHVTTEAGLNPSKIIYGHSYKAIANMFLNSSVQIFEVYNNKSRPCGSY